MSIDFLKFFPAPASLIAGLFSTLRPLHVSGLVTSREGPRLNTATRLAGGCWLALGIGALPLSAQTILLEYDFETPGDTEGWTVLNPGSHPIANFGQRTAINSSEGVLYGEVSTNDPQLDLRHGGILSLPPGYSWGKAEFRVRHLQGDGQGNFTPRAFASSGTHFSVLNASNGFQNLTHPLFARDDGDGWVWMTYSLGVLGNQDITPNRFDPIGGNAAIGDAFEIDHARFTAYPPADPDSLNVVFIMADDLGWSDTTLYGTTALYETPNIERLADRGMTFSRAYTSSPLCSPTRASILTGQSNARNGSTAPQHHTTTERLQAAVQGSAPAGSKSLPILSVSRLDTAFPTLGKQLAAAGIRTGHFGKWHLGRSPYTPVEHGFDVDIPNWFGPGPSNGFIAPWSYPNLSPNSPDEHIEDRMAEEAVNWMTSVAQQQFYLQYWQFSVHAPFDAKESLIDYYRPKIDLSSDQRSPTYAAMVHSLDDAVGTLLDAIDDLGIAERTVIILYSDNGGNMYDSIPETDALGQAYAATPTSNSPLRGGKGSNWDGGVRVPMIVVWPGVTEPGSQSDALTQSTDFYPTILNIMGAAIPADWPIDGVDITPTFTAEAFDRGPIFNYFPHSPPAVPDQLRPSISVHQGDWKLIRLFHEGDAPSEHQYLLFNLAEDIGEQNNLAAAEPAKVAELDALIEAHIIDSEAVVPRPNPAYWAAQWGAGSIWTGGNGPNWSEAGSWLALPTSGTDLIFAGSRKTETVNNFPAGTAFGEIRFEPPFAAFTLSGNPITSGDIRIGADPDTPVTHTLALDLHQTATRTITTSAHASLHIAGNLSGNGNLEKQGAGQLLLSGNNTLNGGLSVAGGTLVVSGPQSYAGDTSVAAGASLHLTEAGSLQLLVGANGSSAQITGGGSLELNGALALDLSAAGADDGDTWTLIDMADISYGPNFTVAEAEPLGNGLWLCTANDTRYVFSQSTGKLQVAAPYAVWIEAFELSEGDRAPGASPAGDGISNLMKYALGLDPTSPAPGAAQQPRLVYAADSFSFEALVRQNDPALAVQAEASIDLTDWSVTVLEWDGVDQSGIPAGFNRRIWNGDSSEATDGRLFFRLRAILNP